MPLGTDDILIVLFSPMFGLKPHFLLESTALEICKRCRLIPPGFCGSKVAVVFLVCMLTLIVSDLGQH